MDFEGPEKKVEIGLLPGSEDLRRLPRDFWEERVAEAGAVILSELRSEEVDAYLLSESSLFVFPRRVVMITCGRTTLVTATESMLERWRGEVAYLFYERKNEHFPEYQKTAFLEDARRLGRWLPADGWRFGAPDTHRIQMLASSQPFEPDRRDRTLEILMHGIHPEAAAMFSGGGAEAPPARQGAFRRLLDGFAVDEHFFEPTGYSLNALRGQDYLTIHVTPEAIASYVSFETNLDFGRDPRAWVEKVQAVFEPRSLDVMTFAPFVVDAFELDTHRVAGWTEASLPCGYNVAYRYLERASVGPEPAFRIPLDPPPSGSSEESG